MQFINISGKCSFQCIYALIFIIFFTYQHVIVFAAMHEMFRIKLSQISTTYIIVMKCTNINQINSVIIDP